jgi:putative transferase (TIGR04331 family)
MILARENQIGHSGELDRLQLITTELTDTWPDRGAAVFLGEWCNPFYRKLQSQALNPTEVITYHWDNRAQLRKDFEYLNLLNEKLLLDLTDSLNHLHSEAHGPKYWRFLIGYWLTTFTAVIFDRWTQIQTALTSYPLLSTRVYRDSEGLLASTNTADFVFQATESPLWNHYLYSKLLNETKIEKIFINHDPPPLKRRSYEGLKGRFDRVWNVLRIVNACFKINDKVFVIGSYLPKLAGALLEIRLRQWPLASCGRVYEDSLGYNESMRCWTLKESANHSEVERLIRMLIPKMLPRVFLEGYQGHIRASNQLRWPRSPRVIWTSSLHFLDDLFKIWAAKKIDSGARLIIGEHGGYGVGAYNAGHSYELSIADSYLSTGWTRGGVKNIFPIGDFRRHHKILKPRKSGKALLVLGVMPRYLHEIRAMTLSSQVLRYLDDQCLFLRCLDKEVREKIVARVYPSDYGWSQKERLLEAFSGLEFDRGNKRLWSVAENYRLVIATYNATTYLEGLSANFPTLIFWDPLYWEVRPEAERYFKELQRCGIFHESPEAAALHLCRIWHDLDGWWNSRDVQQARKIFCHQFIRNPENLLDKLRAKLLVEAAVAEGTMQSRRRGLNDWNVV